jgi:NAD(P)H-hydrate repair Nnr-like enzyme with NAD(P)H-hydrate dehydratase domain
MAVRAWLPQILDQAPRLVLDADALNAVAEDERWPCF